MHASRERWALGDHALDERKQVTWRPYAEFDVHEELERTSTLLPSRACLVKMDANLLV